MGMKGFRDGGLPVPVSNSPQKRLGRLHFVSLLAGLGVLILMNGYFRGTDPAVYYALCSPHGMANIYTVDTNDRKVQCLVVKNERFLHTSAFGEHVERI